MEVGLVWVWLLRAAYPILRVGAVATVLGQDADVLNFVFLHDLPKT